MSDIIHTTFDLFDVFLILFSGFFIGMFAGQSTTNASWRITGDAPRLYRTPHCSHGKFYYVVPEREFVNEYRHVNSTLPAHTCVDGE